MLNIFAFSRKHKTKMRLALTVRTHARTRTHMTPFSYHLYFYDYYLCFFVLAFLLPKKEKERRPFCHLQTTWVLYESLKCATWAKKFAILTKHTIKMLLSSAVSSNINVSVLLYFLRNAYLFKHCTDNRLAVVGWWDGFTQQ